MKKNMSARREMIRCSREMTQLLMREGFIPEAPEAESQ